MAWRKFLKGYSMFLVAFITAVIFVGLSSCSAGTTLFSSVIFPVYGNVYPLGIYYASIKVTNLEEPYFLDVDTGSAVTWVQCDAPCLSCSKGPHPLYRPAKNRLVPCNDPLCVAVHQSTNHWNGCQAPQQCDYEIKYQDHGSSLGVLVSDVFSLSLTNSTVVNPSLVIGCGYDQEGGPWNGANGISSTDGVMGLGRGKISILSQLSDRGICRNIVGHCFSRQGTGFLFFGDSMVPPRGVTWAPMPNDAANYYSPGLASVVAGDQKLADKQTMVFDSGSSYTYFANQLYQSFLSVVKSNVLKMNTLKEAPEEKALPVCWKSANPFKSVFDLSKHFQPIILNFVNGKSQSQMVIPPKNFLIVTKQGNVCLGILNANDIDIKDLNIIGDISMQDMIIVYDNENQRIGWAPLVSGCDKLTWHLKSFQ